MYMANQLQNMAVVAVHFIYLQCSIADALGGGTEGERMTRPVDLPAARLAQARYSVIRLGQYR